ncbi:MAG TPA: ATP synthase subunit I [Syntrophales bacterium]|nr:ATP synthase subunit I [Syntrophales bacterium]
MSLFKEILLLFALGAGLGFFFFGGLWWTVRRLDGTGRPALVMTASFLVRTAVVLGVLFFAAGGDWRRLAAFLLGFLGVRFLTVRTVRRRASPG